jgi:hypothetical protein
MRSAIYAPFWQARVREIWRSHDREPSAAVVLAKEQPTNISKLGTLRVCGGGHELSIRIRCVGLCRGMQPRSNVSMMIMRPPQHGQGYEDGWAHHHPHSRCRRVAAAVLEH